MIFDLPAHHSSVTEMRRMSSNGCLRLWYLTEWYLIIYRPWERQRMRTITTQNDISWSTRSPLIGDRDEEDEQQQMLTITILDRMIFDHLPPTRAAADAYDYDTEWYYLIYLLTTHRRQRWGGGAVVDAYDYDTWQNDIWSYIAHESGSGCLWLRHRMILVDLPAHNSLVTEMRRRSSSGCLRLQHWTEWYWSSTAHEWQDQGWRGDWIATARRVVFCSNRPQSVRQIKSSEIRSAAKLKSDLYLAELLLPGRLSSSGCLLGNENECTWECGIDA